MRENYFKDNTKYLLIFYFFINDKNFMKILQIFSSNGSCSLYRNITNYSGTFYYLSVNLLQIYFVNFIPKDFKVAFLCKPAEITLY